MTYQKKSVLAALVLLGMTSVAGAAGVVTPQDTTLDEYVVTATRINEAVDKVPAMVTVITAKQIANHNYTSVGEALQNVPGLYLDRAAQGGISMRGYDSKNILVLVDGVQMNETYTGKVELNDIPISNIKKIEVTQGAASSLYGGHAVAGVINIITKTALKAGVHGSAVLSYGTYGTWKRGANVDAKINDKWDVGVAYEKSESDGYKGFYRTLKPTKQTETEEEGVKKLSPDLTNAIPISSQHLQKLSDGSYIVGGRGEKSWEHENTSVYARYHFDVDKSLTYRFTSSLNTYQYNNPFSYLVDKDGKELFSGNIKVTDKTYLGVTPAKFLGYVGLRKTDTHALNYQDEKNNVVAHAYYANNYRSGFSSPESPKTINWDGAGNYSYHPGKTYDVGVEKTWKNLEKHIIVAGANWHKEDMVQKRFAMTHYKNLNSITHQTAEDHGSTTGMALYVQDKYMPNNEWAIYTGVRIDRFTKNEGHLWFEGKKKKSGLVGAYDTDVPSQTYTHVSPKVTVEYLPTDNVSYYASYGTSFNPPPLYKIYRTSLDDDGYIYVFPNPALNPETSKTWEAGMKYRLGKKTNLQVAYYHTITSDKIAYATYLDKTRKPNKKGKYPEQKKYINGGDETHDGIEIGINHKFNDEFTGFLNYTYQHTDAKAIKPSDVNGMNLDYDMAPRHILHTGVTYEKNRWFATADMEYVSARMEKGAASNEYNAQDAYLLFNLATAYNFRPDAKVTFGIDNLFNRHFFAVEATAGRTYRVGMEYKF